MVGAVLKCLPMALRPVNLFFSTDGSWTFEEERLPSWDHTMLYRRESEDRAWVLHQLTWNRSRGRCQRWTGLDSVTSSAIFACKEFSHLALEDIHTAMPGAATDVDGLKLA